MVHHEVPVWPSEVELSEKVTAATAQAGGRLRALQAVHEGDIPRRKLEGVLARMRRELLNPVLDFGEREGVRAFRAFWARVDRR